MKNQDIRQAANAAGVYLYEIAEAYGINDGNFSRKLRFELPDEEKDRIFEIIEKISGQKCIAPHKSVDAVEVIRCSDCKYYGNEDRHPCGGDCAFHGSLVDRDDFCSFGERNEST